MNSFDLGENLRQSTAFSWEREQRALECVQRAQIAVEPVALLVCRVTVGAVTLLGV